VIKEMYNGEVFKHIAKSNGITLEQVEHDLLKSDKIIYAKKGEVFKFKGSPVGAIVRNIYDSGFNMGDLIYSINGDHSIVFSDDKINVFSCSKEYAKLYKEPEKKIEENKIPPDFKRFGKFVNLLTELYCIDPDFLAKSLKETRAMMLLYQKVKEDYPDKKDFNSMWAAICMYSNIKGPPITRIEKCVDKYGVDPDMLGLYMKFKG
jgi:hypothetical protein